MKNNKDNVYDHTSNNFDGIIALTTPTDSWVAKWQRLGKVFIFSAPWSTAIMLDLPIPQLDSPVASTPFLFPELCPSPHCET